MSIEMDSSQLTKDVVLPSTSDSSGGDKPSSETVAIPKAEWETIQKTIKRLEDEGRSDKDRAVKRTNEKFDKFTSEYAPVLDRVLELMNDGTVTQKDALKIVREQDEDQETKEAIREIRAAIKNGTLPTGLSSGNGSNRGGKVAEIAKEYGIDENSPEVVNIYREYGDSDEAEKAVLRLAAKANRQPSAGASTSIESRPVSVPDQQEMIVRLNTLQKNPSKHWKEIDELNKKLGWD